MKSKDVPAVDLMAGKNKKNKLVVACFTPGTLIATPRGERKVEDIRVRDRVITRDNGIQQVRWIGSRTLTSNDLKHAPYVRPILIRQGALGGGLPERDMTLSPNHRVLVTRDQTTIEFDEEEVLVSAKHLTGLDGVDVLDVNQITYLHFMFDQHEVILSDGTWSESFRPSDRTLGAMGNAQRNELFEVFPQLKSWEGIQAYAEASRYLELENIK